VGWCADTLRLFWGLLYWNLRKAWFRARRGRARCPCQSPSDSGRAGATGCDACLSWHRPARFRAVCPLLVETPDGLRCSANTADVRPFWGRAAAIWGSTAIGCYLSGALALFIFLRAIGYPVNIFHVTLPTHWYRVTEVRSGFFLNRANEAFTQGRVTDALLYLSSAYEFDRGNYTAGFLLAKHLQVGQPARSDEIFQALLLSQPDRARQTAQEWFRALLARGNFERVATLAREELLAGAPSPAVWVRALIFARRRLSPPPEGDAAELPAGASGDPWRPVFAVEKLLREGRKEEARALLTRDWPETPDEFEVFYQGTMLTELGDNFAALDALGRKPAVTDAEVVFTVRLNALAADRKKRLLEQEVTQVLAPAFSPRTLGLTKVLCAHLIRHPDKAVFERLMEKVSREQLPFNDETAGIWFSLFCAAGAVGDHDVLGQITAHIRQGTGQPFLALGAVAAFFRGETPEKRITPFLPTLMLPLEVTYALLERYGANDAARIRATP
jgi:hypothetical protein